jgi:thimet oligopeptidase
MKVSPPVFSTLQYFAGGYDAQYYGYMWSEVYSEDMFQTVFKETGVLSLEAGLKYRTCILQPGGSVDAFDMLKNMLGREPNSDAFFKAKGFA